MLFWSILLCVWKIQKQLKNSKNEELEKKTLTDVGKGYLT